MSGVWRSCLTQLSLWAATAAVFFYLRVGRDGGADADDWIFSIVSGLLLSMALILVLAAARTSAERRMLSRASRGATPRDGTWTAVSGEIRCSAPMRGPISGEAVLAYEYSIRRYDGIGSKQTLVTYFDGKALAQSTIDTSHGAMRLLTVPALEVEPAAVPKERAITNARSYLARASFADRSTGKARTSALEREWTDDDGTFRIDKRHTAADVNLAEGFLLEERHIELGDTVCVFGVYSAERAGIIPDRRWGRTSRMVRGTPAQLSRALRARLIRYGIGSVVLASAAIGISLAY